MVLPFLQKENGDGFIEISRKDESIFLGLGSE